MMAVNFIRNEIIHRLLPQSLMLAILLGACNIYGSFDNPIDPKGENYKSPDKAITSFSLVNPSVTGTIDEATKTIELTVPYGTSPSGLKATFITTGASVRVGSTLQISGSTANDFINPVIYEVTAEDGSKTNYTVIVTVASSSAKAITNFSIASLSVAGIIDENARTINITVPFGTSITALTASFSTSGNSVSVNNVIQVSNSTSNNFTAPLVYEVVAADGTTQSYAVTVTVAPDPAKTITSFNFSSPAAVGIVTESNHTVSVTVPYGTSVTSLVPTIQISGATISPLSGTSRDFTNPVSYTVTAADGSIQVYTISVTVAANFAKGITSFTLSNPSAIGVVTESNHTIAITVPFGTTVTSLTPTIGISGASISPSSGVPQNFASPVTYSVTASDSTTQTYTVTVTVAPNPAKAITSFNFTSLGVTGVVTESNHTVAITVPNGTSVESLAPTIGITGAIISPVSGVARNFASPVVYTVTAADGTTQAYTVTVTVALNPAKAMTSFSFASLSVTANINEATKTITATVPDTTNVTALVATFGTTGASVKVGSTVQSSGVTANNFTNPVIYTVTASDSTTQSYTVTVSIALSSSKSITRFSFPDLAVDGVIDEGAKTIVATVPYGTIVSSLVATFDTTGAAVKVGSTVQSSGVTANNFTSTVSYIVTASDTSTAIFVVIVTILPRVASVSSGALHTMILKIDGTLWATGFNMFGQLGDGTTTDKLSSVQVMTGVSSVSAGRTHTMILKADGALWATGHNNYGQLGDGTTTDKLSYVQVMTGVSSVSVGDLYTMILKNDGTLWATGNNGLGQLGDGTTTDKLSPIQVMTGVSSVSTGLSHTMILKADGTLWATGHNNYGQLGDGTTTGKLSSVQVMTGVSSVSASVYYHTMILKNDGALWATGNNAYGQLGVGTTTNKLSPVQVMTGVSSVSAGQAHTMILKTDGTLWATGHNSYGQLGDGTTVGKTTSVRIN